MPLPVTYFTLLCLNWQEFLQNPQDLLTASDISFLIGFLYQHAVRTSEPYMYVNHVNAIALCVHIP